MNSRKWLQSGISSLGLIGPLLSRKTVIVVLLLIPACLLLLPSEWLNPAKLPFQVASNGLSKAVGALTGAIKGVFKLSDTDGRDPALAERVLALEIENIRLTKKVGTLTDALERFNVYSRKSGDAGGVADVSRPRRKAVLARIIGVDSSSFRKSILIDKGTEHGVVARMPATWKNIVAGRIANANLWTSTVVLVSDPECKIPVLVTDKGARTIAQGILEGTGDGRCRIKWIWRPKGEVSINDKVFTSGILWNESPPSPAAFPKGLLVGAVVESTREPGSMFWRVVVEPRIDFSLLDSVFIELSSLRDVRHEPLTVKN